MDLYGEPYDPRRPTVCFDETSTQLIAERRIPIPAHRGRRERFDYEYRRNGTRNLFMLCEPLRGWRHVAVTEQRRMEDFAYQMRWLVDEAYTKAERIRVVLDNLNTHRPASLYQTFAPVEARRILKRLEFHYTPKHGSWLNMAEIELSVLSRQCLGRRIPDEATLRREVEALERQRNDTHATIAWRFTAAAARTTLRHLYPTPQNHLDQLLGIGVVVGVGSAFRVGVREVVGTAAAVGVEVGMKVSIASDWPHATSKNPLNTKMNGQRETSSQSNWF